ncbi:MAG: permease, partial [Bosea sp.]|uniref:ABC transporter permease n=1 Tax=Bosea sp. (in: a-proteobacteria) TaxID=1871050 RepID=UPI0031FEF407|nr:permease [Bosea sp. (in: a-proteobacteria)]
MSQQVQDLRFALRLLAGNPGFTAIAVVVLALGIGGNTAIFSLVHGIMLQPLPLPAAERLVQLERSYPEGNVPTVSVPKFHYWREHAESFTAMAGWANPGVGFNLAGEGEPERINGSRVTADFFTVFGSEPTRGRNFNAADDVPGAPPVVILSHGLWQRRFGADPGIVGRSLTLDGLAHLVVGIAPRGFYMPEDARLWSPWRLDPVAESDEVTPMHVTGLLEPGTDLAAVRAEMRVVGHQFMATAASAQPDAPEQVSVRLLKEFLYGDLRPALRMMLAAVGLVLL